MILIFFYQLLTNFLQLKQYMTFPIQATERLSLVPVIAMLLQFNTDELAEAEKALTHPIWEQRAPKEVKLVKILTPSASRSRDGSTDIIEGVITPST